MVVRFPRRGHFVNKFLHNGRSCLFLYFIIAYNVNIILRMVKGILRSVGYQLYRRWMFGTRGLIKASKPPCDDDALDLARALADLEEFLVPEKPFYLVFFHEAVAAV